MTSLSPEAEQALVQLALAMGDVRVLMTPTQLRVDSAIEKMPRFQWGFLRCSRRWGKTVYGALRTQRASQRKGPRSRGTLRYCAPTKQHGRDFVIPAFEWVASQMPREQRPRFDSTKNYWLWPNGARCILGSSESRTDVGRQKGTDCDFALVDEAGEHPPQLLDLLISSALTPQFLTTDGTGLIAGTPPDVDLPDHPYWLQNARCEIEGYAWHFTIDDIGHVDAAAKAELVARLSGGRGITDPRVRRELYVERVKDEASLLVPEWSNAHVREATMPAHKQWFAVGDFGFHDLSFVIFAWFDFLRQAIVVEHEIVMHRKSSLAVGDAVKALEAELGIVPEWRLADAPLQTIADMADAKLGPGVIFGCVQKDDRDSALAVLRNEVGRGRFIVHPRCVHLQKHLEYGYWNTNRTDFARPKASDGSSDPLLGHFDGVAAAMYLNRAIPRHINPAPRYGDQVSPFTHHIPQTPGVEAFPRLEPITAPFIPFGDA